VVLCTRIEVELELAQAARGVGNEGRARVCARRAAGLAAGAYLERHAGNPSGRNAHEALRHLARLESLPDSLRAAARRLTVRVDQDFKLPHAQDPLEDARTLIEGLLQTTD